MRTTGLILVLLSFIALKAQTQTIFPATGFAQQGILTHSNLPTDSNHLQKKWFVSIYSGIGFFNTANSGFLPLQVGLQLNRRLNNNLYAFAGVSATPAYFNFNRSFNNDPSKNFMASPAFGANTYGIYPGIQAGLMYVNDERTFSISGSIGVSNGRYPYYPNRIIPQKQLISGTRQ